MKREIDFTNSVDETQNKTKEKILILSAVESV